MSLNIGEKLAIGGTVLIVAFSALKEKEKIKTGPFPRPQYTLGSAEVNKKINALIVAAEQECLASGTLNTSAIKKNKKAILGTREDDVRILCQQPRQDGTDNVKFKLQIGDGTHYTRGGKQYMFTRERIGFISEVIQDD